MLLTTRLPMVFGAPPFSPAQLFAAGAQGIWLDPSDFTTGFQDSAGTTPQTAVAQPTGKRLDKSGRGHHVLQATTTTRPTLNALYNRATSTESVGTAAPWTCVNYTVANNALATGLAAGQGPAYLARITATATQAATAYSMVAPSTQFRVAFFVHVGSRPTLDVLIRNGTTATALNSALLRSDGSGAGNGWTFTPMGGGVYLAKIDVTTGFSVGDTLQVYYGATGGVTAGLYWYAGGMDIRTASDAALNIPTYQRVNTAADYDTAGFPLSDVYDGVDDNMLATAWAAATMGASMDLFVAVKRSNTANGILAASGTAGDFLGCWNNTDQFNPTTSQAASGFGLAVNGVAVTDDRQDLGLALPTASWKVLQYTGVDLSTWTNFGVTPYGGGFFAAMEIGGLVLCPAQSAGIRASLRTWLGAKVGLSL